MGNKHHSHNQKPHKTRRRQTTPPQLPNRRQTINPTQQKTTKSDKP